MSTALYGWQSSGYIQGMRPCYEYPLVGGPPHRDPLIILPAFNEGLVLASVIAEIRRAGFTAILVVDDGSRDCTRRIAYENNVWCVSHSINRGKGAALQTGFSLALRFPFTSIVTMDADLQHDPMDIPALIEPLTKGCHVSLGVRTDVYTAMPRLRIVANALASLVTYLYCGLWVADSQCGFRAYSREAIAHFSLRRDRYEYDMEVIREIKRNRLTYAEVPVRTRYSDYSMRKETRQSAQNGIAMLMRMVMGR